MKGRLSQNRDHVYAKIVIKFFALIFIFVAILFLSAGTLNWPEAWILLFFYFLFFGGSLILLRKNHPGLLEERMSAKKGVKGWDRIIMGVYAIILLMLFAVTGLDSIRYRWSEMPVGLKALGLSGFVISCVWILWIMKENSYLSKMVRIQKDRGQKVCTTGPYQYLRHPMYAGVILSVFSFPLCLGSFLALLPSLFIACLFILRASLEDKALLKELPGYQEYAKRVRFKMLPGVW